MAGERSGNLDAVLRRFVAYSKTIDTVRIEDHLRDDLSDHPGRCWRSCSSASSWSRWCRRLRSSTAASTPSCRCRRGSSSAISDFVRAQFWLILIADRRRRRRRSTTWIRQPGRGAQFDRLLLKLPFIGASFHKFSTSQMARTLATLLGGGIPLVNALEIAARSTGNRHMGRGARDRRRAGSRGPGLCAARCSSGRPCPTWRSR